MKILGGILLAIGILMLIINGFNFTTKEEVAQLGPIEINKEKEHSVNWPMYIGGIVAVAGVGLLILGARNKS